MTNELLGATPTKDACPLHRTSKQPSLERIRMASSTEPGKRESINALGLAGESESRHAAEIIRRTKESWEVK